MEKLNSLKTKRGFTIIELIVVFAIIAILASVIIFLISQPKTDAINANIKVNLQTVRKQAEIYFINNSAEENSYGNNISSCTEGVFSDEIINNALVQVAIHIDEPKTITCQTNSQGNKWAVLVNKLHDTSDLYCLDSSGYTGPANSVSEASCISGS